jgi:hypothetical protein
VRIARLLVLFVLPLLPLALPTRVSAQRPLGPEQVVNLLPVDFVRTWDPHVSTNAAGEILVTWMQGGLGRLAPDGTRRGKIATLDLLADSIAVGPRGNVVLVWQKLGVPGATVLARRFTADGVPLGPAVKVNPENLASGGETGVALTPGGGFAVTWDRYKAVGSNYVFVGRFRRR